MVHRLATAFVVLALGVPSVSAQNPIEDTSPFRTLDLPAPNSYRTASGRPGPAYWQQRVDYRITATLDVARHELHGRETIRYTNHSPDTLSYLWMHVEQNMCASNSVSNQLKQPPLIFLDAVFDFSCQGFVGGTTLEHVQANGAALRYAVYGTTMRVDLPAPLDPGAVFEFEIGWRFTVPPYGMARMGRDGSLYEIAQWYPRLAVYDDVRGWNNEPYIGAGEFYLEYGSFDVSLTVPATYVVAATGTIQNPEEVLTPEQRRRLAEASTSDVPVAIITREEAGDAARTRPTTAGTLTWHFTADTVRDFAFAASPTFRWDATSWNGILIQTLYRPAATQWEEAIRMARQSIAYFSEQWYPYPYPHATTIEGPIEGMEYPMLTFVPNNPSREDLHWVLSHEFGHEWFPMLVGSNERFYPWMDEGFNTFIDLEGAARYFAGTPYGDSIETNPLRLYADNAIPGQEQPLSTRPAEQVNLFWTAYQKPALMLQLLRHEVLGKDRFDPAFRAYIGAWANKHPTPADFFRLMRDASGMDLDWFWRGWIYTTSRLDQAVESVTAPEGEGTSVMLINRGTMVMPLELKITYADGETDTIKLPVEMWNQGPRFTYRVSGSREVRAVEIDPRQALPDVDRSNNGWTR